MKTPTSVPDDTFDQATKRARELGMSRSEFFARAAMRPDLAQASAHFVQVIWVQVIWPARRATSTTRADRLGFYQDASRWPW